MIKILHSADWHLDAPLLLHTPEQSQCLRTILQTIPQRISELCKQQQCDLVLLSGDLFDGGYSADTVRNFKNALADMAVPVFIAPGNHDYVGADSPWLNQHWPENVHIFSHTAIEAVPLPQLDCRIYGAGFTGMDCPALLEGFTAQQAERYAIGVFHADPTQTTSSYCPVTAQQVERSNLDYLALGHIHKGGSFRAGKTLCAWPGCPMGRGYDELGQKGVLITTMDAETVSTFIPLGLPEFHDLELPAEVSLSSILPGAGNENFYRITFTGPSDPLNLNALAADFSHFPNLELRDRTVPPLDIWGSADTDSFEGMYFQRLKDALQTADDTTARQICLAAKISRQILEGQEVVLP